MADQDGRSWAEKRMDARREARGLPTTGGPAANRLVIAFVLAVVGVVLVSNSAGIGFAVGVVALLGAGYQFLTAAIAQGVKDGRG